MTVEDAQVVARLRFNDLCAQFQDPTPVLLEAVEALNNAVEDGHAAVRWLAHYLARAVNKRILHEAINNRCTCGGRPPDENACCPACHIWHDLGLTL